VVPIITLIWRSRALWETPRSSLGRGAGLQVPPTRRTSSDSSLCLPDAKEHGRTCGPRIFGKASSRELRGIEGHAVTPLVRRGVLDPTEAEWPEPYWIVRLGQPRYVLQAMPPSELRVGKIAGSRNDSEIQRDDPARYSMMPERNV
jgi:hypothetical protein